MSELLIYQHDGDAVEVRLDGDTVWLRQGQMAALFGRDRTVIGRHIRNAFAEAELARESNVQNLHIAGSDKPVRLYSLDVIISVGYRVKSVEGTRFRQWATRVLREHLTRGFTLSRQRFEANARELEAALTLVRQLAANPATAGRGGGMSRHPTLRPGALKSTKIAEQHSLAVPSGACTLRPNHARLASTDFGRQAHFGGFFLFGGCA